jgi:iron complex transport system substrate-binding protein
VRKTLLLPSLLAAAVLVAACGDDDSSDDDAGGDGAPETATAAASGDDTEYPLTVETCGEEWTYDAPPERVVVTDTAMLDVTLLLGLGDRVSGVFANNIGNVDPEVVDEAAELELLGDAFPFPGLEAVLAGDPDLVLNYGYNPEAGFTAERLAEQGVNNFTVAEGCPDFSGEATVEGYFDEVRTLGAIFDVADRAEELIAGWEERIADVEEAAADGDPVLVLNTGSGDPTAPFASGGTGITDDMITIAGGENVFADVDSAYFEPSWEEVVDRDPEVIVESSGGRQEGLDAVRDHLEGNPALSVMAAVQDDNFTWLTYEEGVPGPQMITGIEKIADAVAEARADA